MKDRKVSATSDRDAFLTVLSQSTQYCGISEATGEPEPVKEKREFPFFAPSRHTPSPEISSVIKVRYWCNNMGVGGGLVSGEPEEACRESRNTLPELPGPEIDFYSQ